MAAVSKFLFDTAFDADIAAPRAAGAPAAGGRFLITREEFDAAKAKAQAEGLQAGYAKAQAEATAQLAGATAALGSAATKLLAESGRRYDANARDAVAIGLAVVRQLLPGLVARDGTGEIEALLRDCLSRLNEEPRVVVRVNDALIDHLRDRLERIGASSGFPGRLVMLADPALAPGDARIEWADGGVERTPAATQAEIVAAIDRFLNASGADTTDRS